MRFFTPFCFALLVGLISCNGEPGSISNFDCLLFVRKGGGDKVFTVTPTRSIDTVEVSVSRYDFRDTLIQFRCGCDPSNANAFLALNNALHGKIAITGDFHQPTLFTGTWAYLYMVHNMERFEITNTDLRNQLLAFETIIKRHLQ